jgi:hypothetical protein
MIKNASPKKLHNFPATLLLQNSRTFTSIHPWFITGFSDAESSFMLFLNKNNKCKTGYGPQACFQIGLHEKDRALLEMFRASLGGVGNIAKQGKDSIQYRVTSAKDLRVIVDHFDKYPLITHK